MLYTSNLGFPRIGRYREAKKALENYWKENISKEKLLEITHSIRLENWKLQVNLGIQILPSNDFSLYDQMLDTICMLGAIPPRYSKIQSEFDLETYFAMARGKQDASTDIPAMEMTKWFNTNYHHIVPEIEPDTQFSFTYKKILDEYTEAKLAGFQTRPVLIGPLTFLLLSKTTTPGFDPLSKLEDILPVYQHILAELAAAGADWVQIDEPMLVKDLSEAMKAKYQTAYQQLCATPKRPRILLTTYFDSLGENFHLAFSLPVEGIHLDLVSGAEQWEMLATQSIQNKTLSLGVIDGHNVWRADLDQILKNYEKVQSYLPHEVYLAPSCSLLHVPQDMALEEAIDQPVKSWLSFAVQKLEEINALATAINENTKTDLFAHNRKALKNRKEFLSKQRNDVPVQKEKGTFTGRANPYPIRREKQKKSLTLPVLPTTTIGSFPQTGEVRSMRACFQKKELPHTEYQQFLRQKIKDAIQIQEKIGLDVLVHGEFERNDMVQYFAEQMQGFIFTSQGWVQSFGSRYVRPPIIYGDVNRPKPMTVGWSTYAQSLTTKPVKGMLTGPVTILQWSFVRDDQSRAETCRQIAQAMRAEVLDLERAGIRVIQIDEPALREGLPLKKKDWQEYLDWAVECFQITNSGVKDETQIHTHMCYAEFNEIIASIAALGADVISIEAARSNMELLNAFSDFRYPNEIGPGVYDIHSPRVPSIEEMTALLEKAIQVIPADRVWVNPDCGLKTRGWEETIPALENMVAAAKILRKRIEL